MCVYVCVNLDQPYSHTSVMLIQCVSPHGAVFKLFNLPQPSLIVLQCVPIAIVNLLEPASTQFDCATVCPHSYCQPT